MSDQRSAHLAFPEFRGRIGVARRDGTPPVGIYSRAWGSSIHDVAEGVHRPLLATCVVFQNATGTEELIFLTLDVMVFWQPEAERIRAAILRELGLEPQQLILHPSHSHGSPILLRKHADRPGGHLIAPYLDSLPRLFCELIAEARTACRESIMGWAYGKCGLAFNRDAVDPGSRRDVCGLNPAVSADDTVLVARITDAVDGSVRATIVNYACHPVSLGGANRLLSPDYIGAMRETVESHVGGLCVFLHGASGDTTPRRSYEGDVAAADQNGRELGYAALAALNAMPKPGHTLAYRGLEESGTPLGIWAITPKKEVSTRIEAARIELTLPICDMPTRAELEAAIAARPGRVELEKLERAMDRRAVVGDAAEGRFYFTVWRLGDAFILATPAEPYCRFQINLRARFPDTTVAVLNASDGCLNYLPTPEAFGRDVYQARISLYRAGAMETVMERAAATIQRMR